MVIERRQLAMRPEIGKSIIPAHEPTARLRHGDGCVDREGCLSALSKEHCQALILPNPTGVVRSLVGEMGFYVEVQFQRLRRGLKLLEAHLKQQGIAHGLRHDFLHDAVTSLLAG